MDFQDTLLRLRDNLEQKYQFRKSTLVGGSHLSQSTDPIEIFIAWLDNTPEALQILKELAHEPRSIKTPA